MTRIHIPTFDTDVLFFHDVDRARVKKYVMKNFGVEMERFDETEFSGLTVDLDGMTWLVYVPSTTNGDLVWLTTTLSHEANHVTLQLMEKICVKDDETTCYCQDNLLGQLL